LVDETPPLKARVEWLSALDNGDGSTAPVQQYLVWYKPVESEDGWQTVEVDGDGRGALLDNLSKFFNLNVFGVWNAIFCFKIFSLATCAISSEASLLVANYVQKISPFYILTIATFKRIKIYSQMQISKTFNTINFSVMGTEYILQMASVNGDGYSENVTERLITPVGR
jgi:hypothetical protein